MNEAYFRRLRKLYTYRSFALRIGKTFCVIAIRVANPQATSYLDILSESWYTRRNEHSTLSTSLEEKPPVHRKVKERIVVDFSTKRFRLATLRSNTQWYADGPRIRGPSRWNLSLLLRLGSCLSLSTYSLVKVLCRSAGGGETASGILVDDATAVVWPTFTSTPLSPDRFRWSCAISSPSPPSRHVSHHPKYQVTPTASRCSRST